MYDYNFIEYKETVELKVLFKRYFKIMDELLKKCSKKNFLLKSYCAQAWGALSKYRKIYVDEEDLEEYDWGHMTDIQKGKQYEYYSYKSNNGVHTLVKEDNAYRYGGLGRIKTFLSEYSRNYMLTMLTENNLEPYVMRIQTDGICFSKPIDFPSMGLNYYPIPEKKTTGKIKFYNINYYTHCCDKCNAEYKYDKHNEHKC